MNEAPSGRALIVAVSPEGVIGVDGRIPWHYPGDLKRFKRLTTGTTVIMGRRTYESIGRPLPNRRNLVITQTSIPEVECYRALHEALAETSGPVWFIGGARIYAEAMRFADRIDLTEVPDHVDHPDAVRFPEIDPELWEAGPWMPHDDDPRLRVRAYHKRGPIP